MDAMANDKSCSPISSWKVKEKLWQAIKKVACPLFYPFLIFKGTSKNVIPAPISIGINSSRNPEPLEITGLPPEFTPCLIRGGSDKMGIIRGSLNKVGLNDEDHNHRGR